MIKFLVFYFFMITLLLFFMSWFSLFLASQHFIIILICLELLLLVINMNFCFFSMFYDDLMGQLYGFFVLMVAAAESSLGLALVVVYFSLRAGMSVSLLNLLKA